MSVIGTYVPGRSLLHRVPAGPKLLALLASIITIAIVVSTPVGAGVAIAATIVVFGLGGIGPVRAWPMLRGPLIVIAMLFAFQWVLSDLANATVVCAVLVASVGLATVVTLTTRTSDILDTLVRVLTPLEKLGVRTDLIAMALALTIRSIPLIAEVFTQVDQARRARGLRPGPRVLFVPAVLAALDTADGFADTMAARGLD